MQNNAATLDAEQAVLSVVLTVRETMAVAAPLLTSDDFYLGPYASVFAACQALHREGAPVDPHNVSARMERDGTAESIGGFAGLFGLANHGALAADLPWYCGQVREAARRREAVKAGELIRASAESGDPLDGILAQAEGRIRELARREERGDLAAKLEAMDAAFRASKTRIPTHIQSLSRVCSYQKGLMTYLTAPSGFGKTRYALGEIRAKCKAGTPVKFFSLEMPEAHVLASLVAVELGIPFGEFQDGMERGGAPWLRDGRYERAKQSIAAWPLRVDDRGALHADEIAASAIGWRQEIGPDGLMIVDYAGLIQADGDSRHLQQSAASKTMTALAKSLDIPILMLGQVTLAPGSARGTAQTMPDVNTRDSQEWKFDSESMLFIDRPHRRFQPGSAEAMQWRDKAKVWILKNRYGTGEGVVTIGWKPGVGYFHDLDHEDYSEACEAPELDDEDPFGEDDGR